MYYAEGARRVECGVLCGAMQRGEVLCSVVQCGAAWWLRCNALAVLTWHEVGLAWPGAGWGGDGRGGGEGRGGDGGGNGDTGDGDDGRHMRVAMVRVAHGAVGGAAVAGGVCAHVLFSGGMLPQQHIEGRLRNTRRCFVWEHAAG